MIFYYVPVNKFEEENLYKNIGEIYCPYFQEKIIFNAKGLEHLKFVRKNHARPRKDQYIRFRLLYLSPEILKLSKTVQGVLERKIFELNRSNHKNEYFLVEATYFEFIAVIKNIRARIIIKQIEKGKKYFWSIIPYWKVDKKTQKRNLSSGNPEED